MSLLGFPPALLGAAIECEAVAMLAGKKLQMEQTPDVSHLSLGSVSGRAAVVAFLAGPLNLEHETRLIQANDFVQSEIRPYAAGSRQLSRALTAMDGFLGNEAYRGLLGGEKLWAGDVVLAAPLIMRQVTIQASLSSLPLLSSWLTRVKEQLPEMTSKLLQLQPCQPKKEAPKTPKGRGEGKGSKGAPAKAPAASARKLKILCLHGYRQSGKAAREKLGSLRKAVGKLAELDFVTAPHNIPGEEDQYGWWFSKEDKSFDAHDYVECELGFQESIDTVKKAWQGGSYDGIFAFSQGASLGAHLCLLQKQGKLKMDFKFAILVAGFPSRSSAHQADWQALKVAGGKVTIPTLHMMGETDKVIEKEMSEELLPYFESPHVVTHEGGHHVPATGNPKTLMLTFLKEMQEKLQW